jgi:hypothetical protein
MTFLGFVHGFFVHVCLKHCNKLICAVYHPTGILDKKSGLYRADGISGLIWQHNQCMPSVSLDILCIQEPYDKISQP